MRRHDEHRGLPPGRLLAPHLHPEAEQVEGHVAGDNPHRVLKHSPPSRVGTEISSLQMLRLTEDSSFLCYRRIGADETNSGRGVNEDRDHNSEEYSDRDEDGGEEEIEQFVREGEVQAVGEQRPGCGGRGGGGGHAQGDACTSAEVNIISHF